MIQARIVADSVTEQGHRLSTLEVVMPRYILAEFNTHRVLSKNSASSRAIPFRKMVKSVLEHPFIPYAFQKDHVGMQGTEYLDSNKKYKLPEFLTILSDTFKYQSDLEFNSKEDKKLLTLLNEIVDEQEGIEKTLKEWWLYCRDKIVKCAVLMASLGVTKQLANRLLEPFMYHKVLVSGTEWENFFNLRCPQYTTGYKLGSPEAKDERTHKSWKDVIKYLESTGNLGTGDIQSVKERNVLERLQTNKGQADIHMMFLAEAIYDAMNESTPTQLKEGEWHIPYGDNMDYRELGRVTAQYYKNNPNEVVDINKWLCQVSIARCARLSYQTLGDNPVIDYEADLKLYEVLSKSGHWSPFEHVAKVMNEGEYNNYINGYTSKREWAIDNNANILGWCRNFRGFIQQRALID